MESNKHSLSPAFRVRRKQSRRVACYQSAAFTAVIHAHSQLRAISLRLWQHAKLRAYLAHSDKR
eukprot:6211161-Pleurochrysis_carterae.AAC.3